MNAPSLRRGWCPGARRPMETGDGLLVRVHPPGGRLGAAQARALADAAEAFGNGLMDVTARGNLQIRGVSVETHASVLERLSALGLLEPEGAAGPYRVCVTSPLAGLDQAEVFDAAAVAEAVEDRLATIGDLPAKFYVSIDGGAALPPGPGADIAIVAVSDGVAIGLAAGEAYVWCGPVEELDVSSLVAAIGQRFAETRGDTRRVRDLTAPALTALARAAGAPSMQAATDSPLPCGEGPGVRVAGEGYKLEEGRAADRGHAATCTEDIRTLQASPLPDDPYPRPLSTRERGDGRARDEGRRSISESRSHSGPVSFPVGEGGAARQRGDGWGTRSVFGEAEAGPECRPPSRFRFRFRFAERVASLHAPSVSASPSHLPLQGRRNAVAGPIAGIALLLALPFGRATAFQLRAAAETAERHGTGEIRLSHTRGLLLPGIGATKAHRLAAEAEAHGFIVDPDDPRLALVACPGAPACTRAETPAPADALALAEAFAHHGRAGARLHVSACAKGCAHPRAADLTLVGQPDGRYGIVPGGSAGDRPVAILGVADIAAALRETPVGGLPAAFGGPSR